MDPVKQKKMLNHAVGGGGGGVCVVVAEGALYVQTVVRGYSTWEQKHKEFFDTYSTVLGETCPLPTNTTTVLEKKNDSE